MIDVFSKGIARVKHAKTGRIYDISADELDWDAVGSDERNMGPETHYQALLEHPQLGLISWNIWEYPIGAENMQETDVGEHILIENLDYGLQHLPDDDEWEADDPVPLADRLNALPQQLEELEKAINQLRKSGSMIGHNQPPEEMRIDLDEHDLAEAQASIDEIKVELKRPNPAVEADLEVVKKAESRLSVIAEKLKGWAKTAGKFIGGGVLAGMGKELWEDPVALHSKLQAIINTLTDWSQSLGNLL
ncbi:hypothetical protein [Parasphingorhabdus sp.]|uniref:hypothetical protein n=1 Tax=Parasphingorhabdus sp. TaxID=2709688 RepID=UPI003BB1B1EA